MNFLFLRGLARHHGHWYGFENNFIDNNQVLCIDIPGNGDYSSEISKKSIKENVEFVRMEWKKKKIENGQPWCVVAISMGAMIALTWEYQFPNDFEKIFIINTSAKNFSSPFKRFSLETIFKLPKLIFSESLTQEKTILDITLNLKKVDDKLIDNAMKLIGQKTSTKNFFIQLNAAANFSLPSFNPNQNLKIIVICSLKDRLVDSSSSLKISSYLKTKIFIHPSAGHDLPLDDGEWLKKIIIENIH